MFDGQDAAPVLQGLFAGVMTADVYLPHFTSLDAVMYSRFLQAWRSSHPAPQPIVDDAFNLLQAWQSTRPP